MINIDTDGVVKGSKYGKEFKKKTSVSGNLTPRGKQKELYDVGYDLMFGKITWEEYEKKKAEIINKWS
jgi:hypothetical protein